MRPAAIAGVALIALGGCLPIPYSVVDRPEIAGYVLLDGVARPGLPVTLVAGPWKLSGTQGCSGGVTTTTDGKGAFHFDGHAHGEWPLFLLQMDRFGPWRICFGNPESPEATFSGRSEDLVPLVFRMVCSVRSTESLALRQSSQPLPDPGECWMRIDRTSFDAFN